MSEANSTPEKVSFLEALRTQRWDDHRYYHHSRINQSLHLLSAFCFLTAYVMIWIDPVIAALTGWILAMVSRQIGHFFFEPKSYDHVNKATHEHKEAIKIGYNLERKVILLSVWGLSPLLLKLEPSMFGLFEPHTTKYGYLVNLSLLWIYIGIGAILVRTAYLCIFRSFQTGIVWVTKILTDPFHDVMLYHKAPFLVLKGEMMDPMTDWPEQTHPSV